MATEEANLALRIMSLSAEEKARLTAAGKIETARHIARVRELLRGVVANLEVRAAKHDASKLASPEAEVFGAETPNLRSLTYGSPEYEESKRRLAGALSHHYANNPHHPEYYPERTGPEVEALERIAEDVTDFLPAGEMERALPVLSVVLDAVAVAKSRVNGMSLLDLVEMFVDWKAATERHADGDLGTSIGINRARFGYGPLLENVFRNTARELGYLPPEDRGAPPPDEKAVD